MTTTHYHPVQLGWPIIVPDLGTTWFPMYSAALGECVRREALVPGTLWGVEPVQVEQHYSFGAGAL